MNVKIREKVAVDEQLLVIVAAKWWYSMPVLVMVEIMRDRWLQ